MDINQALIYYGSDQAKQDFLIQQEQEKKRLIQEGAIRNDSIMDECMENQRNVTEYRKGGRQLIDPNTNMFLPLNAGQAMMMAGGNEKNYQAEWRSRYSEKYNKKWGRANQEKIVKQVDTFGGKYEDPLIQNRHKLMQKLGIRK